jgi:hypothetical protein
MVNTTIVHWLNARSSLYLYLYSYLYWYGLHKYMISLVITGQIWRRQYIWRILVFSVCLHVATRGHLWPRSMTAGRTSKHKAWTVVHCTSIDLFDLIDRKDLFWRCSYVWGNQGGVLWTSLFTLYYYNNQLAMWNVSGSCVIGCGDLDVYMTSWSLTRSWPRLQHARLRFLNLHDVMFDFMVLLSLTWWRARVAAVVEWWSNRNDMGECLTVLRPEHVTMQALKWIWWYEFLSPGECNDYQKKGWSDDDNTQKFVT